MGSDHPHAKTMDFEYSDETYRIEILDAERLRWTRTRGEKVGIGGEETYICTDIGSRSQMITWVEADGLGLSSVLNHGDRTLLTHASTGREVFVNEGTFTEID